MTEMNVSATVGMGNVCNSGEIEYGQGNLRVGTVIYNFDRLPFRLYGITC